MQNRSFRLDPAKYLELSGRYGWKLYSHLSERIEDRQILSEIYEKGMERFCELAETCDDQDALDKFLAEAADYACEGLKKPEESPNSEKAKSRKGSGFGFWLAFTALLLLNLACLWVILGLLMDMGILPEIDLGYSWAQYTVIPWLEQLFGI